MVAPALPHVRFVLPTAGKLPVTINGGMRMPAWYDIVSLDAERSTQLCDGIQESQAYIQKLVAQEESAGIPSSRIVLAGFSQGGAMSLFTALQSKERLAGVACLSGYLPAADHFGGSPVTRIPMAFFHGDADPVVRLQWAKDSLKAAEALGVKNTQMKVYAGLDHGASQAELED
ncbi:Lypla1, partial [Symbiodinium sp. KB8]